jgi:hypothetical protein
MVTRACGVVCGLLVALFAGFTSTAKAGLIFGGNCPDASTVFSQWNDSRYYVFATNGGFEAGSSGWALSGGANVVNGNEPFYLHSDSDSRSLYLPRGASATSPPTCMATSSSVIRFVSRGDTTLRVQIVERNLLGFVIGILNVSNVDGTASWQPSPQVVNLQSLQGLLGVSSVQVRVTAVDGPAQIDDLFVDPMASRD